VCSKTIQRNLRFVAFAAPRAIIPRWWRLEMRNSTNPQQSHGEEQRKKREHTQVQLQ